jgi:hypothetical protein
LAIAEGGFVVVRNAPAALSFDPVDVVLDSVVRIVQRDFWPLDDCVRPRSASDYSKLRLATTLLAALKHLRYQYDLDIP